jgi:hypothetical protein
VGGEAAFVLNSHKIVIWNTEISAFDVSPQILDDESETF